MSDGLRDEVDRLIAHDDRAHGRLHESLDRIETRIDSLDRGLSVNNVQLAEHMRRTALLEDTIVPISRAYELSKVVVKVSIWLAGASSATALLVKLLWNRLGLS
jgi:hypothetical protein